jgi:hypothetical protein
MSIRFILVLILTGISVTVFFFYMGNSFNYSDSYDLILTNLLYQNDYILYFSYILFRFKPFRNTQSLILLIIYLIFLCIGISGAYIFDADKLNKIYFLCEGLVRLLFVFYFLKYFNLNVNENKISIFAASIIVLISLGIYVYCYEEIETAKLLPILLFYAVIILYTFVGNCFYTIKARNKVFFTIGLFLTFTSDFFTLLNISFNIEVYMFTLLRLVSFVGEFLVIYVILDDLKYKMKSIKR